MRLFVAIELPVDVKKHISEFQESVKESIEGFLRPVTEPHLTLHFLGDVENPEEIIEKLDGVEFSCFSLEIDEFGGFPNLKKPRVLWLGVNPKNEITRLKHQMDKALGFELEEKFVPHITIFRVKKSKAAKKFSPEKLFLKVNSFSLIKSTLTKEGPVYETLRVFKCKET